MADEPQPEVPQVVTGTNVTSVVPGTSADAQPQPAQEAAPAAPVEQSPAPAPAPVTEPQVRSVVVNQYTRRGDEDALLGSWVDVIAGDYAGRKGGYVDDDSHDPETGYPRTVLVRTRDAENELIAVNYADIRPSSYTGGR